MIEAGARPRRTARLAGGAPFGALKSLFASDASNAIIADMAALTIRQLDQKTKTRLRGAGDRRDVFPCVLKEVARGE
jgi:hypothetical protein